MSDDFTVRAAVVRDALRTAAAFADSLGQRATGDELANVANGASDAVLEKLRRLLK